MTTLLEQPLPVPVPPKLAEAFGYDGDARYVAFWWDGDELAVADGTRTLVGGLHWYAWRLFTEHLLVMPHLFGYDFGGPEGEARHRLLLDRKDGMVFAGTREEVEAILRGQPRAHHPAPVRARDHQELQQKILRQQALEHRVYEDLRSWLDGRVQ